MVVLVLGLRQAVDRDLHAHAHVEQTSDLSHRAESPMGGESDAAHALGELVGDVHGIAVRQTDRHGCCDKEQCQHNAGSATKSKYM